MRNHGLHKLSLGDGYLYPTYRYLNVGAALLGPITLVWDGDTSDASPDFTSITLDINTPVGSYFYVEFTNDDFAAILKTATPIALTENQIKNIDPIVLTMNDLSPGVVKARAYTKDPTNTARNSEISASVTITVSTAAAPTVVGYQEATYTSGDGTTATFTIPTTGLTAFAGGAAGDVQDGDTLIIMVNSATNGNMTPSFADTTGITWETLAVAQGVDSNDSNLRVARCVVSAAPASTITITGSASTDSSNAAILVCLRNYTGTFDVASVSATGSDEDTANPPSITPVTSGALVMAIYAAATNNFSTNTLVGKGPTSGFENYLAITAAGGATKRALLALQTLDWTSGAVDPPAIDPGGYSSVAASWTAYTIAITP